MRVHASNVPTCPADDRAACLQRDVLQRHDVSEGELDNLHTGAVQLRVGPCPKQLQPEEVNAIL